MTILYVNGDSHTAGAEAVNSYCFDGDDGNFEWGSRLPHPTNLSVSWGKLLSDKLMMDFVCQAESGGSNTRILRTTRKWLDNNSTADKLGIIQWSTWEREEWLDTESGKYYQVNGSGIDIVPPKWSQNYKEYVANIDWNSKTQEAHQTIWDFHQELKSKNIPHIFFNGNNDFSIIGDTKYVNMTADRKIWGKNYISPYDPTKTYDSIIRSGGFTTVNANSWHFGKDGHRFFSEFMLQYIIDNQFLKA